MTRLISILLIPFSLLFGALTRIRNYFYDCGLLKTIEFDIPVISIGNIRVGGTGKTPFTAYMVDLVGKKLACSTLSRGYGRKTEGFLEVTAESTTYLVGDEALMLKNHFDNTVGVYVCEDRAYAIPHILFERPDTGVIILDDAFQHRRVDRDLNILLSDYNHPFYRDFLMPAGRLREGRYAAKRADCVVITKCPDSVGEEEKQQIIKRTWQYTRKEIPVFFSSITYMDPVSLYSEKSECGKNIILFTGIADPGSLIKYLELQFNLIHAVRFADHHEFTRRDLEKMVNVYKKSGIDGTAFVCTEKDMVRLHRPELRKILEQFPVFYIPIVTEIVDRPDEFESFVWKKIENNYGVN